MKYQDIWNLRRYQCSHRSHHPVIYVNTATSERLADEAGYGLSFIPWHDQEPEAGPREHPEPTLRRGSSCPEHGDPLLWAGEGILLCQQGHSYQT